MLEVIKFPIKSGINDRSHKVIFDGGFLYHLPDRHSHRRRRPGAVLVKGDDEQ